MQTYHEASSIQASVECLNQLASILGSGTVAYERVGGLLTVDGITYRLYTLENDMDAGFPADNPEEGFYDGIVQEDAPAEVQVIVRWTPEGLKAEFVPLTAEEEGNGDQETGNH